MKIKARVTAVLKMESGVSKRTGEEWKSQTIIVEYINGEYPEKLALKNMKRAEEFAKIPVGATGEFSFSPKSNEYNGRWYTQVDCYAWILDAVPQEKESESQPKPEPAQNVQMASDSLPF